SFLTKTLGASPVFLGLVEGVAEAVASLLKIASGWLSDRTPRRKPFVVAGYALSTLTRPLVAFARAPGHVLAVRVLDRIGKGTRSAPRDAILAHVTSEGERGRAFGFQRAMDHAGAVIGPLLASGLLLLTDDPRLVFASSLVPGGLAGAVRVVGLREAGDPAGARSRPAETSGPGAGPAAPTGRGLLAYLLVLAVFTLGNSSDAFLLMRAQEVGVSLALIPIVWTLHHVVKSAASTYGGALSDRLGRRAAILAGWTVYAIAYAGFAAAARPLEVFLLFAWYGLFHALTEGVERALVADLAEPAARGRAFGLYHAVTGGMLLPASVLTGSLWGAWGPRVALYAG